MTAQPIHEEDPHDPEVILHRLPERERAFFLAQYREHAEAAREPGGYKALQAFLHRWSIRVIAVNRPGYYEDIEAARNEIGETISMQQVIAQRLGLSAEEAETYWAGKVAEARARRAAS